MPIYEFKCTGCHQIDDIMCSIKEGEELKIPCELCQQDGLEAYFKKIISATRGIVTDGASPRVLKVVKNVDKS